MPRFEMVIHSQDYYSNEGSWTFKLPKTVSTKSEAEQLANIYLKEILEPTAGGTWISKTHFRFDRDHCEGNATYEVNIHEISEDEENWVDFVSRWNEVHPNNRPDDWKGLW